MIFLIICQQGHALAGGCVLALVCDYRVLAQDSNMAMVETLAVGLIHPATVIKGELYPKK